MSGQIYTAELIQAQRGYAEAVKTALAGANLSPDQMQGRLAALLGDLWNQLEADLRALSRRAEASPGRVKQPGKREATSARAPEAAAAPIEPAAQQAPVKPATRAKPEISAEQLAEFDALLPRPHPASEQARAEAALVAALKASTPEPST